MPRAYVPYLLYMALAAAGWVLLTGQVLFVFLVFTGGLAVKSLIGQFKDGAGIVGTAESTRAVSDSESSNESAEP